MNTNNCCIANILEKINNLQNTIETIEDVKSTCDRPYLGCNVASCICNTRPVTFYNCNNQLITMPYTLNETSGTSSVFRIESVNECCATLRVLAPNTESDTEYPYLTTNSFFTINTKCICAIKCLADTFVECV